MAQPASDRAGSGDASADVAVRYAYALVPFGVGVWLAHYGFHFLTGGLDDRAGDAERGDRRGGPRRCSASRTGDGWACVPGRRLSAAARRGAARGRSVRSSLVHRVVSERDHPEPLGQRVGAVGRLVIVVLALLALWILSQPMEMRGDGARRMIRPATRGDRLRRWSLLLALEPVRRRAQRSAVPDRLEPRRSAPTAISIWTDPDTTDDGRPAGQFWIVLEPADGRTAIPAGTQRDRRDPAARSRRDRRARGAADAGERARRRGSSSRC